MERNPHNWKEKKNTQQTINMLPLTFDRDLQRLRLFWLISLISLLVSAFLRVEERWKPTKASKVSRHTFFAQKIWITDQFWRLTAPRNAGLAFLSPALRNLRVKLNKFLNISGKKVKNENFRGLSLWAVLRYTSFLRSVLKGKIKFIFCYTNSVKKDQNFKRNKQA